MLRILPFIKNRKKMYKKIKKILGLESLLCAQKNNSESWMEYVPKNNEISKIISTLPQQ